MVLYYEDQEQGFVPWTGQDIAGIRYPQNLEQVWSAAELAEVGLYTPVDPGVPDGKVVTATSVARVNGLVQYVYTLADATPSGTPISMRQLRLGLVRNGYSVNFILDTINAMPDGQTKDEALIWYEETSEVDWDHPMTQALIAATGIPTEQAAAMWLTASAYPA